MTVPSATDLITRLGVSDDVAGYLGREGVLLDGHFQLLSGLHSPDFIAFSGLARDGGALDQIADTLTETVAAWMPEAVIAPSTAGVSLGSSLSVRASAPLYLASLDMDSRPDGLVGNPDIRGKRVLLVNDVITTGSGLKQLARVGTDAGAEIAGAAWFVSRADVDVAGILGTENVVCLASFELEAYSAAECPLCAAGGEAELAIDLN